MPPVFPVSVKGVMVRDGRVLLLRNEREEWELPGGRIEIGETPQQCLTREIEIAEATGWPVKVEAILNSWMYHIPGARRHVFIATYGYRPATKAPVALSAEHREARLFTEPS